MKSVLLFFFISVTVCDRVLLTPEERERLVIWCTVNSEEQKKCEALAVALQGTVLYDEYGQVAPKYYVNCTQRSNKDECMAALDKADNEDNADMMTLDPGEVYVGGRQHSLVPIMEERYPEEMYSIAVVRKGSGIHSLRDIRDRKACFGEVGTLAGWVVPLHKLQKAGVMEVVDCNNHVKSALAFFGSSCAVNSLSDKYNPLGDNSDKLCEICGSHLPGVRCTSKDPYAGFEGTLHCLMDKGEIGFLKHSVIREYYEKLNGYVPPVQDQDHNRDSLFNSFTTSTTTSFPFFLGGRSPETSTTNRNFPFSFGDYRGSRGGSGDSKFGHQHVGESSQSRRKFTGFGIGPSTYNEFKDNYHLLCEDGTSMELDDWRYCNWGSIPAHAVVTSSAKPYRKTRRHYQEFLNNLLRKFGDQASSGPRNFRLFESTPKYGNRSNLLFQDSTVSLRRIHVNDQTYTKYLANNLKSIVELRTNCSVGKITLCITSKPERDKCFKLKEALNAQLLRPELTCHMDHSHAACMRSIQRGESDVAIFDSGDVYTAGYMYDLIPVMSEIYNSKNMSEPSYYAVAVAYQGDADTELTYLKGKFSCHSGIGHGAGWIIPMAYLISSGRMRNYGCDSVTAASQYFTKSCVPGALSKEHTFGSQHNNLCDLCRGISSSYCSRDASEDFYGYTGAFRCLVEGGGQVAFVKHTTVSEVTDGKRRETWARNTLSGDYELLCRDGTRAPVTEYERCNLGKVKANAVVIRGGSNYNDKEAKAIINLFKYAQQYYGRKDDDDFSFGMFYSEAPHSDLIFQDAAQQLQEVPENERNYRDYLGKTFLKARALVDCRASADILNLNLYLLCTPVLLFLRFTF